ncbi:hypothetical protein [Burkholderia gladioli]|uniref:hypothetical protein n=1 Tax=Burkholderia gladioli TaxID=28095 RepID=UPI00163E9312|nr:hypothetical protein [Burkholderia gladioli]
MKKIMLGFFVLFSVSAHAQKFPLACEQYFKAVEVCSRSATNLLDRTNPPQAEQVREGVKNLERNRAKIREKFLAQPNGNEMLAKFCTTPDFVNLMTNTISSLVVPLQFAGALDDDCQQAMGEIRVPPQQ